MVKCPATLTSDSDSNSPKKKPKSKQLSQKPLEEEDHGPLDKENVLKSKKHHRKAVKKPQVKRQIILVSKRKSDRFMKASHWFPCAINLFIDISAIETTMLESLNDDYERVKISIFDALDKVSKESFLLLGKHHTAVVRDNFLRLDLVQQSDRRGAKPQEKYHKIRLWYSPSCNATTHLFLQRFVARLQEPKYF
ncbi:hypothetical protein BT96DRAFT_984100 [Gymnopus androsaceus JB14]|uniref:Uncharacterized protein n=1 Tax=Gymnopus androsaceus JB14 TaxID=1447944 RepID=A0A6A4IPJ7_9AGAR|nr:hypothetical protein BT96DRAFT_984100 [Gymnopus androsaceus JB14]